MREIRYDLKTYQKEQFNHTIKYFQKYFLWRDENNRQYRFKPFTKKWCKLIENILEETFNPTQLQKEFLYLSNTFNEQSFSEWYTTTFESYSQRVDTQINTLYLKEFLYLSNTFNEQSFSEWYTTTFESYSQRVDTQINTLYLQIDRLVIDFRQQISNERAYDLSALKSIVNTLEDIRYKTEELNNAFSGAYDIRNKLLKSRIITEDILLNRQCENVLYFFQEVQSNLKIISKRIDSVKPRLNEYIRNINRHDFYIRFKCFFNQLLEKSTLEKGKIHFPNEIPSIPIRNAQQIKFIIVKENFDGASLSQFKTAKSKIPITNEIETENRFILEKERFEVQKRINSYMFDLENRLKMYQEVDFSAFFYEVLKKENGNINICVKLAHKTMYKYHRGDNTFGISISNEMVSIPEYPIIKIWKTIIYKRM